MACLNACPRFENMLANMTDRRPLLTRSLKLSFSSNTTEFESVDDLPSGRTACAAAVESRAKEPSVCVPASSIEFSSSSLSPRNYGEIAESLFIKETRLSARRVVRSLDFRCPCSLSILRSSCCARSAASRASSLSRATQTKS
jgi:hypothetical protein